MVANHPKTYSEPYKERRQTLTLGIPADRLYLLSDRISLRRILVELMTNACKYTPERGEIQLEVVWANSSNDSLDSISQNAESERGVIFKVKNQAEIPANELPYIFEKFYRVPERDQWRQGGTGLGLALVQMLVKQLQGTIHVESHNG